MQYLKCTVLFFVLMTATAAFATGEEHVYLWDNFAYRVVNLCLFLSLCYFFFGKKIKAALKGRTSSIADEISTLEARKAETETRLAEIEKKVSILDQERENILTSYRDQGILIKEEIIAQAEKTALQIKEQAKNSAESELSQTISSMRDLIADEIFKATEKAIVEKMTSAEQEKLINESLSKVVLN